uniref:Uncharacterized protein n=1 Tax=Arundo donax TaxID=35708 RepID=A0A0A9B7V4_ARUDO
MPDNLFQLYSLHQASSYCSVSVYFHCYLCPFIILHKSCFVHAM